MKKIISSTAVLSLLLTGCGSAETVETKPAEVVSVQQEGQTTYNLDGTKSKFNWEAYKIVGGHVGTVDDISGSVFFEEDALRGGSFEINLQTITSDNEAVTKHLKTDEFFDVDNHPIATFAITSVTELADDATHTHQIDGNLTIKEITNNITFPATIKKENEIYTATANFDIDRLLWDINFRSVKFFEDLGDAAIKDNITFNLELVTSNAS